MKKTCILLLTIFCFSFADMGLGWDIWEEQVKIRFDLNPVKLDLGLGFYFEQDVRNTPDLSASVFGIIPIHNFSHLTGNIAVGANIEKMHQREKDFIVEIFGGYQPEFLYLEHLIISTRFGLILRSTPELELELTGPQPTILESLTFIVMF